MIPPILVLELGYSLLPYFKRASILTDSDKLVPVVYISNLGPK
jgi:hypothetical protein